MTKESASFGFRNVSPDEKTAMVRGVFESVASRYDLMNDVMSGGMHRLWKNSMVSWLAPRSSDHILDMAGGTGDIAFRMRERSGCKVTIADINQAMLAQGRDRAIDRNILEGIEWACVNAESLPFPDTHFDAYTIAFGIRNVTDIPKALREAHRVLKPGGRFLCMEFSQLAQPWLQKMYDTYSFNVIPKLGEIITGDAASYRYLVESIRLFPDQKTFADMITAAGFGNVQFRNLTGGVAAMHSGRKF